MRVQLSPPLVTFFFCAALAAGAQTDRQTGQPPPAAAILQNAQGPDLQVLVTGLEMAQRTNHAHTIPYAVTREYVLFSGADQEPKGIVVAEVRFQPPATKTWEIKKTTGSERAEKVVKMVLEREAKYAKGGKIAISHDNYDFRYLGAAEFNHRPCYILRVVPKRDNSELLRGRIWVDHDTFLIHSFEGEPAKSPSWWIKELKLSIRYGDLGGVWLPTTRKGVAEVRLFGQHTMTERTLNYRTTSAVLDWAPYPQP